MTDTTATDTAADAAPDTTSDAATDPNGTMPGEAEGPSFEQLGLNAALLKSIKDVGYEAPTPIQIGQCDWPFSQRAPKKPATIAPSSGSSGIR